MTESITQHRTGITVAMGRLARFTATRYKLYYLLYAVVWTLAVEATAALVSHPQVGWRPGGATAVRVVVVAGVLLYLRMVDEQKDLGYDRIHYPDRPLVTGAITTRELQVAMTVLAAAAIGASLALSVWSGVWITVVLGYGLVLWGLERASAAVRDRLLLNLAVTYPVQVWLTVYVVVSAIGTGQVQSRWVTAGVAVVFAGAFLGFEFARKTTSTTRPGQWFYSNILGATGSAAAVMLCSILAVGCDLMLVQPWRYPITHAVVGWIAVVALIFPLWGTLRFRRQNRDYPVAAAVLFILTLYATLITQALVLP
ncbi:UbiA prenyltransferase family protein [Nocardia terpenica]|uniref:hypothetical protein n=1 Tax=Nocardia terpenica TaxID=455432 RepID=UPI002B4B61D5|nr:hypothetical protein [Nocardia terpenica]